jgi:hypothetical protein
MAAAPRQRHSASFRIPPNTLFWFNFLIRITSFLLQRIDWTTWEHSRADARGTLLAENMRHRLHETPHDVCKIETRSLEINGMEQAV